MSDTTTTITAEKRKMFREDATFILAHEKKKLERIGAAEAIILLLNALEQAEARLNDCGEDLKRAAALAEQAEARAEKAESDNAALEEDLEATEKNLKETSGFIEELLSGLKHRFPVQYADLEGNEYGDDAFSSHDLFELVIDPAVDAAKEQAEAENTRLTKMADWLANQLDCPSEFTNCAVDCAECRKEAARRAVAAGEG